jgi:hypothetical protein
VISISPEKLFPVVIVLSAGVDQVNIIVGAFSMVTLLHVYVSFKYASLANNP